MYHISLCFSWVALFGLGVRGWNKADPILKLTGSPKPEPEGSPPRAPAWQRPRPTKVQFVTSFWGGGKGREGKKPNTTGRVIWCSFDPLSPLRWKGFQFLPDKEDHFSTEPLWASKLSRNFNQRQITVYCVMYFASAATIQQGQRGKNKALHYTDKVRRGRQGESLLDGDFFLSLSLSVFDFFFFSNHENLKLDYVKNIAAGDVKRSDVVVRYLSGRRLISIPQCCLKQHSI